MPSPDTSILLEAQSLTYGDRNKAYGDPTPNFQATADLLNAFFKNKYPGFPTLKPEDIPPIMIATKMARMLHSEKRDNLVDIAGYADTWMRVIDAKAAPLPKQT